MRWRIVGAREKARMRRLVLVALLLLSALPAWAVDDANTREKEATADGQTAHD